MDVVQTLQTYTTQRLNQNSFLPNVTADQSFFSQLDTLVLQPFYTFIYLNNSSGNNSNFLEYFDTQLFGSQSSLPFNQQLKWFRNFRNETSENTTLLNSSLFKNIQWADKTDPNQQVDLQQNKRSTIQQAYFSFRQSNSGLEFSNTILASYDTFVSKWNTLLQRAISFRLTQHHPVYNGTLIWNQLPISLRRKWKLNLIDTSDPFLDLVNVCVSAQMYDFFETEQVNQLWPIYDAHGLPASTFDPKYFRVPVANELSKCLYFPLPAIWEQLNGRNEIEGKWYALQYIVSRLTQGLGIDTDEIPLLQSIVSPVETQIKKVDRTQRFGCSFAQTLNRTSTPNQLSELDYINNNIQLYPELHPNFESDTVVTEQIPRIPTIDHTDYRYTYDTRLCDTSSFTVNLEYLQTVNVSNDNTTLQHNFIDNTTTYELFNVGVVEDPRTLQQTLFNLETDNYKSLHNAMRYAEEYLVNLCKTITQFKLYLNEFFNGAVPTSFMNHLLFTSQIGSTGSAKRITTFNSIKTHLITFLKNLLESNTNQVGDLSFKFEIRKLTYDDRVELQESINSNSIMTSILVGFDPSNELQNSTVAAIHDRHTTRLGTNTSDIHNKSNIYTPFSLFKISPHSNYSTIDALNSPQITERLQQWNETPLFPCSFDSHFGTMIDNQVARRYVNSISSTQSIRRPITYGESIEITKQISGHSMKYNSIGEPIKTIGNYGYDFFELNEFIQTSGLDPVLENVQTFISENIKKPYNISIQNRQTVPSVITKQLYIPLYGLLSNQLHDILPRFLTGDSHLEIIIRFNKLLNFYREWSSAQKTQTQQLTQETGNYYIRDQSQRPGLSEFELRNPFASQNNPQYLRNLNINGSSTTIINAAPYPSLKGDTRNFREQLYKMWCGYPIASNHPDVSFTFLMNTLGDRVVPHKHLPWYSRIRHRPPVSRFFETNQIQTSQNYHILFHYEGFKFTPEANRYRDQYKHFNSTYETIDNFHISSTEESLFIPTTKKIEEIIFTAEHDTSIIKERGLVDSPQRILYINENEAQCHYFNQSIQPQRLLDGSGLWLGTNNLATRYAQLGVNPFELNERDLAIPQTITSSTIASLPQFDTNFRFAGESRFPVLVEYPSIWKDLHGSITQPEDFQPFIHQVERPCLVWSTPSTLGVQTFSPNFFKSIVLNVLGDEIAPKKDPSFYHQKYSYEYFERQVPPNIYGIQFAPGYFDFGATTNIRNRTMSFVLSQTLDRINTNIDTNVQMRFELAWNNILFAKDVEGFRWVRGLGVAMIDKVVLKAGGVDLQTLTREWLWIQSRYTLPFDKQDQWDRLVGNTADLYDPKDPIKGDYPSSRPIEDLFLPRSRTGSLQSLKQQIRRANLESQPQMPSIVGRELRIPLTFFFHQNIGKSFPLIALQYAELEMEVHLRPYQELFTIREASQKIDTLRNSISSNKLSKELRNAIERDPPTRYVSPLTSPTLTLQNNEPTSSNMIRYMTFDKAYQNNSWNLSLKVEADFIYLKEDERRQFAVKQHEYLVDDLFQEDRPVSVGSSNVEYRIFHPLRQMFWWIQRDDLNQTNEWMNWTQFDSVDPYINAIRDQTKGKYGVANNEYPIRAFQDTIEESLLGKDRISPSEIWLQDEHLQRGVIPNFFLKGIFRDPQVSDPTAQQCLHLLYRYGFRTRFGNWFLKRLQYIANIQQLSKLKKEAYEFIDLWKYRNPNDIPIITRNNYIHYTEHAMETATVKVHNHRDSSDEEKTAEYWNLATSWNAHPDGHPLPGCYCNSFALEPFLDQPTGSLNTSMIDSITIKLKIREPPFESRVANATYNMNPFINRRRTMTVSVEQGTTGNLTGNTTETPLNSLTSIRDESSSILDSFIVNSTTSLLLQERTDNLLSFLQGDPNITLADFTPQSNISVDVEFGNYTYQIQAQEPSDVFDNVITWFGLMDDVVMSNFEYYQENRLDYPQLTEKGSILENKDPVEIYNDAAVRRAEIMDMTETRNVASAQWGYRIYALFHRWNVIRIENGIANKVFAN